MSEGKVEKYGNKGRRRCESGPDSWSSRENRVICVHVGLVGVRVISQYLMLLEGRGMYTCVCVSVCVQTER